LTCPSRWGRIVMMGCRQTHMKAKTILLFLLPVIVSALMLGSCVKINRDNSASTADLAGTWHYHAIVSGDTVAGHLPGWLYGSMTVDDSGDTTFGAVVDSLGNSSFAPASVTLGMDSSRMITPTAGTGRWMMTEAKDMMIMVTTGALGSPTGVRGYNLVVFDKEDSAVGFSTADMAGTWYYHAIVSGDTVLGRLPGWLYGSMTVDGAGDATFTAVVDSVGNTSFAPAAVTLSIDSTSGVITPTVGNTGRWMMTRSKDMMIMVATGALGSPTGVRGYNLSIMNK
jgi:hypothetical protein